jgi:hypothetical protein
MVHQTLDQFFFHQMLSLEILHERIHRSARNSQHICHVFDAQRPPSPESLKALCEHGLIQQVGVAALRGEQIDRSATRTAERSITA